MDPVISVNHVTMEYKISRDRVDSLKEYFIRRIKGTLVFDRLKALDDVSFTVEAGEVLGIIGLNGSGKSTLLKLISGILKPTRGAVARRGIISPLIELGAGFDHDLTARENVFLNGAVLGFSKKQMAEKYDGIIAFAELEAFQDMALKTFSSGMHARLGFAIATAIEPEILIVDEILGVGDFQFQQKSERRIMELMTSGATVLLVSHAINQIERLCTRAIWLEQGRLVMDGEARKVCAAYEGR
jgi:ABC-2 type transport system ATP-binding protein/lipopolysaccharide transport system ATP-binding protein